MESWTYFESANFRFSMEGAGTVNSSFYVRKPHWWWLSITAVVSCLLTSHTWLWCCMHKICMFTWFALYCEIWVFLYAFIRSIFLVRLQLTSGPHEYMIDGLSRHPCIACKSDALDSPLENLPIQFLQQLLFLTWKLFSYSGNESD